jgi:hypothetical protein
MVTQLLVVVLVVLVTVGVAVASRRFGAVAGPTQSGFTVPSQLDRSDFDHPARPWLVTVFSSATCGSCAGVAERAVVLDSDAVAVAVVPVHEFGELHTKYRIDGVPTTLIADAEGTVVGSFLGPVGATELWDAVAQVRDGSPGTADPGRDG